MKRMVYNDLTDCFNVFFMRLVVSPTAPNNSPHVFKLIHNSNAFSNQFKAFIDMRYGGGLMMFIAGRIVLEHLLMLLTSK